MSPSSPTDWNRIARALDPLRTLELGPELEGLYVEPPYSPSASIARKLGAWQRSSAGLGSPGRPPKFLFCGARGSGKTTQLRHLFGALSSAHDPLLLDLAPVLAERASTSAIVTHMGLALLARQVHYAGGDVEAVSRRPEAQAFAAALQQLLHPQVDAASRGGLNLAPLIDAIGPVLIALDVVGGGAASAVTGLARAATEGWRHLVDRLRPVKDLSRSPSLTRQLSGDEQGAADDLVRSVGALAGALHGISGRAPVLLVDGLDKMLRLEDALAAFENVELLRGLDLALVMSGPVVLRQAVRFAGLRMDLGVLLNHNLPVVDAAGRTRAEGVDALTAILSRRLDRALARRFEPEAVQVAARMSSGVPREFLRFLSEAAQIAEERDAPAVTLAHVQAVLKETRLILQQSLTSADVSRLGAILDTHRMGEQDRDQELFYEGFIVSYPNDDAYFRPNEILEEWVRVESGRLAALPGRRREA